MIRHTLLNHRDTVSFVEIAGSKDQPRQGRLMLLRERVAHAYDAYANCGSNIHGLVPIEISEDEVADLKHCYDSPTGASARLLASIRAAQGSGIVYCPYCGYSEAGTFDHLVPKSKYPEFSVLSNNLALSCSTCNNSKRSKVAGIDIEFVHPYFHGLGRVRILDCNVQLSNPVHARYFLDGSVDTGSVSFETIDAHFHAFDLYNRYSRLACEHLPIELDLTNKLVAAGSEIDRIEEIYLARVSSLETLRTVNGWQPVFLRRFIEAWLASREV